MSQRAFILCGLCCAAFAPSLPSAAASPAFTTAVAAFEETFKASDYETLGKLIAAVQAAHASNKGLDKAQEDYQKALELLGKRLKRDPLSMPGDMGKALWMSYDFDKNQKVHKGKVDPIDEASYWDPKTKLGYVVWTPAKYDPRHAYPLILCIPDQGKDPKQEVTENWIDPTLKDNVIIACVTMPTDAKTWLDAGDQGKQTGVFNMLFTLGKLLHGYAIDFDRVYLAGRGAGVEAAVTYASRFPDRFAGVIGRSGDAPADLSPENLNNLSFFFAGAGGNATKLEEKLKALGYTTLSRKDDATEADIWAWMQAHPRPGNPTEVVMYPGNTAMHSFWLESFATDATGAVYIKAKIDRKANTITVEGEGITKFTILYNDDMVDLDKPVKVVANGSDISRTVQRSSLRSLDFIFYVRSDPGRFYVNSMQYDLPPKPKPPAGKTGEKGENK